MSKWFIYDIETIKNFFCICFEDVKSDQKYHFIIDENIDQTDELKEFIRGKWLIGYNNKYFDDIVLNYIITGKRTVDEIFVFSQQVISSDKDPSLRPILKPFKYPKLFKSIDLLTMLFSKALRPKLKELQVTMNYPNVQELPYNFREFHTEEMKKDQLEYCFNDVNSTKWLYERSVNDLKLRKMIQEQYGIDCLSKDGVKVAVDYISKMYCEKAGLDLREFSKQRYYNPEDVVHVKDVIFPHIKFKTKEFNKVLDYYKSSVVIPKKKYPEYNLYYNGTTYSLAGGGIHSLHNSHIIKPSDNQIYYQSDVSGEYPNTIISNSLCPKQLDPDVFLPIFTEIYSNKKKYKLEGDKLKETFFKLCGNSTFGMLINEYGPLFAPNVAMGITINCQLQLLMLIEELELNGIHVLAANTDAVEVLIEREQEELYLKICSDWEKVVKLSLDHDKIKKIIRSDINNYIAVFDNGKVKTKGKFIEEVRLGKGYDKPVIAKAIVAYFTKGIPFESFIRNHNNIYDFCICQKVGSQYEVLWNNKKQQHVNRYYVSKKGAFLYKVKNIGTEKESKQNMLAGFGVQIFNKYEEKPMEEYNIDYRYYISEARKIILELEPLQLNLF